MPPLDAPDAPSPPASAVTPGRRAASAHATASPAPRERMVVDHRGVALAYRVFTLVLIAVGIARISGVFTPEPIWKSFLYYTVQSNVLCLVWVALLIVWTIRDLRLRGSRGTSTPSPRWSGAVMMAITVTMIIYLVVLVPSSFVQGSNYAAFTLTDNLIHIVTPCLLIVDWLLFVPKGTFRWRDPLLWALIPYAYLVFAFTYSALGGTFSFDAKYPYPFMDVEALGLAGVAGWLVVLTVGLVAVGYVYVVLDWLMGRTPRPLLERTAPSRHSLPNER